MTDDEVIRYLENLLESTKQDYSKNFTEAITRAINSLQDESKYTFRRALRNSFIQLKLKFLDSVNYPSKPVIKVNNSNHSSN